LGLFAIIVRLLAVLPPITHDVTIKISLNRLHRIFDDSIAGKPRIQVINTAIKGSDSNGTYLSFLG